MSPVRSVLPAPRYGGSGSGFCTVLPSSSWMRLRSFRSCKRDRRRSRSHDVGRVVERAADRQVDLAEASLGEVARGVEGLVDG